MLIAPESKSRSQLSLKLQVMVSRCFLDTPPTHTACSTHTLTHSSHIPSLWLLLFPGPQRGSGHNLVAKTDASSSSHHFAPSVNSCIQFLLILPNLNIIILLNLSILCPSFSFGLDHLPGILQLLLAGNSGLILLI